MMREKKGNPIRFSPKVKGEHINKITRPYSLQYSCEKEKSTFFTSRESLALKNGHTWAKYIKNNKLIRSERLV
jgi:hypothetical protein